MAQPKDLYAQALQANAKRYMTLEDDTIRQANALLLELKRDLQDRMVNATDFETQHLQRLLDETNAQLDRYASLMQSVVGAGIQQAVNTGIDAVIAPLEAVGYDVNVSPVVRARVNALIGYAAELVRNISEEVRAKITTQIRLGVLGGKTPLDIMREITKILGYQKGVLVEGVGIRAEMIVRTEMTRIYNLSAYSQQLYTNDTLPGGVFKAWRATGDRRTRQSHLEAAARYNTEPIPVDKPFIVGGAELMYPGDPAGPAKETVHCRCKTRTILPAIGALQTPEEARIAAELERRQQEK